MARQSTPISGASTPASASTSTGISSSRPIHMSTIIVTVEPSPNGANEPNGPANPKPGPTLPIVVAAAAMASMAPTSRPRASASISRTTTPSAKTSR